LSALTSSHPQFVDVIYAVSNSNPMVGDLVHGGVIAGGGMTGSRGCCRRMQIASGDPHDGKRRRY